MSTIIVRHIDQADSHVLALLELKFGETSDQRWLDRKGEIPSGTRRQTIKRIVEQADGNVAKAMERFTDMPGGSGFSLGNWGQSWGANGFVIADGSAPGGDILLWINTWYDSEKQQRNPPQYQIKWRAVFEFVAGVPRQTNMSDLMDQKGESDVLCEAE